MEASNGESEIFKPRNDKREYRRIVLPNSLEALIISDPETDKSAASMDVSVGYFSDPEGVEGLAHFLGRHFGLAFGMNKMNVLCVVDGCLLGYLVVPSYQSAQEGMVELGRGRRGWLGWSCSR
ncbi:hypothetical protein HPP92_015358 [Vanilla planifolia]|uniref:Peptidase M16 N-terminal domain-containing protein n=1 Tax=Vanilla planifolia TaxID=51239 RepID=A0A835UVM1_VANPL|nr:hypothetical protein HPP92_015358 [Vanilla planifolia]